jgi:hypothetical protein
VGDKDYDYLSPCVLIGQLAQPVDQRIIAEHANEATTLRYAEAANAQKLRSKAKPRYG